MSRTSAKLKSIQTQLRKLGKSEEELDQRQNELDRERHQNELSHTTLTKELEKLHNRQTLLVSEHAILRYLERIKGLNLEEIKEAILTEEIVEQAAALKFVDADIPCNVGGFRVRIKERTIVTILTK